MYKKRKVDRQRDNHVASCVIMETVRALNRKIFFVVIGVLFRYDKFTEMNFTEMNFGE